MKKVFSLFLIVFALEANLNGQNNPPVAIADTIYVGAGMSKTIDLLINDSDPDGNSLSVDTVFYSTGKGILQKLNTHFVKYTADSFYFGLDTAWYEVCDNGIPSLCDTAMILIVVQFKLYDRHETLDINNVSAMFNSGGDNFWDYKSAKYEVPKGDSTKTIFAEALWIGGKETGNNSLHLAATMYDENGKDFYPGPAMQDASAFPPWSSGYFTEVNRWNRLWKINKSDIDYHISHWNQNGYVVPQVFSDWPAHGDTTLGQAYYLAPFHDNNLDGKYNPANGDYPIIKGDQAVYFIYNDNITHEETGGIPLKVEVQGMGYSFNCTSDSALWNTVFINYKIINRSANIYDSTYLGIFADGDLGCPSDDYVGCDVERGSFYFYNGDNLDEDCAGAKGYGNHPPAQSVTFLAGPKQDADGYDKPLIYDYYIASISSGIPYAGLGTGYGDSIADNERMGLTSFIFNNNGSDPAQAKDYYNYMKSVWKDGTPMVYGGNGHVSGGGTVPAKYMFPDTTDPLGWGTGGAPQTAWNEITSGNTPGDRRGLGSSGPFTFKPGDVEELDLAFVFGRDYVDSTANAGVVVMKQRIDAIRAMFVNDSTPCGGSFSTGKSEIKNLRGEIVVYPNPASENIIISLPNEFQNSVYEIYDLTGRRIERGRVNSSKQSISLKNFSNGIYLLKISDGKKFYVRKFVKQ